VLVSGVGSVGERHIRNLIALGQDDIAVHRTREQPFRSLDREFETFRDLERALAEWRPQIVFATGPTSTHLPVAIAAAEAGAHVFVEKPLTDRLDGIDRLEAALERNKATLMVGYMLRFHPLLRRMKVWVDDGTLGKPLHWRSTWGEYLPDWHPWEDYREGYAARRDLGGGPALTFSHDLDIAHWMFGDVERASAIAMPSSPLQMDGPPGVDMLLRHKGGVVSNLHLDFWQRPPQRSYELVGTRGRATLDYYAGTLTRYEHPEDDGVSARAIEVAAPAEIAKVPSGWDRNEMFCDEVRYFLGCLERGDPPTPGVASSIVSARLAMALGEGGQWRSGSAGVAA
jgi:predicted dehydrogenase